MNGDSSTAAFLAVLPSLAWVVIVGSALYAFRRPLAAMVTRVNKVSFAGVDVALVDDNLEAAAKSQGLPPATEAARSGAARRASERADLLKGKRVVWLDAHPEHNIIERRTLRSVGLDVSATMTRDDAVFLARTADPDVVLTNYGAGSKPSVAAQLITALAEWRIRAPVIVYTVGSDKHPKPKGTFGATDRPEELLHLVIDALERGPSALYGQV